MHKKIFYLVDKFFLLIKKKLIVLENFIGIHTSFIKIKLIFTTSHGGISGLLDKWFEEPFDTCYIDEASQLDFTMCSNGFKGKKIVLIGDKHQLPPLTPRDLPEEFENDENIQNSLFHILCIKKNKPSPRTFVLVRIY